MSHFLPRKEQGWRVLNIGTRMIKCGYFVLGSNRLLEAGLHATDIQEEGLLSSDEVGTSAVRVLEQAGTGPVALVLPDSAAMSQVIDAADASGGSEKARIEASIRSILGLSEGRFVHDASPLPPFGPYRSPYWVTVAREETLCPHFAPLISQGLRIEFATTAGNALMAEFLYQHPEIPDARIVDFGANQTTVGCLEAGQPRYLTTLPVGGEMLVEALIEAFRSTGFEGMEKRLLAENLFVDPTYGPVLKKALNQWRASLIRQFSDWNEDAASLGGVRSVPVYIYGGFSLVPGLLEALNADSNQDFHFIAGVGEDEAEGGGPVLRTLTRPLVGAVFLAAGRCDFSSSILPRALAKMRTRWQRVAQMRHLATTVFLFLAFALLIGSAERGRLLQALEKKNLEAEAVAAEVESAVSAVRDRDHLARRIVPMMDRWIRSIEVVETLRLLQQVREEFDFGLRRLEGRRTFSDHGPAETRAANWRSPGGGPPPGDSVSEPMEALGFDGFVVEVVIEGDPAARLDILGAIVQRLREEPFFQNVDRQLRLESNEASENGSSAVFALTLSLSGQSHPESERRAIADE